MTAMTGITASVASSATRTEPRTEPSTEPSARVMPPAPSPLGGRPRVPLRVKGLLAILGVMILALLLLAAALVFRGVVANDLEMIEQARMANTSSLQYLADARHHLDAGSVIIACLAWLGITSIGAVSLLFFSRMATDIDTLRARALSIVTGDRSRGETLTRNDELSDLAQAIDHLADALARHERELQIERHHVMHREKLALIGSMAAGLLREIGNPIAAIDGYARAMQEVQAGGNCGAAAQNSCDLGPILLETARLGAITHDIAELAATPASQYQLASPNEIVVQAIKLLRYEPSLIDIAVTTTLDPQLPAVMAAADRLVLLLTHLVINAADATVTLPARTGRIEIATRRDPRGVELSVTDNGCGMSPAVHERAFDPLFTTKPAGRGSGLGLTLCRAIVQDHGGQIRIDSAPGHGSRVSIWLPFDSTPAPATFGG